MGAGMGAKSGRAGIPAGSGMARGAVVGAGCTVFAPPMGEELCAGLIAAGGGAPRGAATEPGRLSGSRLAWRWVDRVSVKASRVAISGVAGRGGRAPRLG